MRRKRKRKRGKYYSNSFNQFSVTLPFRLSEQRIIVMGKMGVGKSSFCNTLFGKQSFTSADSFAAGTSTAKVDGTRIHDRHILVVDTPGFRDNGTTREKEVVSAVKNIAECFLRISPGFHCIVFVISNGARFTRDDKEVLDDIVKVFGEEVYGHMILVFTQAPDKTELLQKLKKAKGPLQDLLQKVENRVFAVENTQASSGTAELFFKDVDRLILQKRKIFGNEMLIKAWLAIEKYIKDPEDRLKIQAFSQEAEIQDMMNTILTTLGMFALISVVARLKLCAIED